MNLLKKIAAFAGITGKREKDGNQPPEEGGLELGKASKEFMEKLLNWTFPGAVLYYRDAELDESIISMYKEGQILRSPIFVDVSGKAGKPLKNCRFAIASSKAMPAFAFNREYERWAMYTMNVNSYFKVLDIYRKEGVTQILLLHIPALGVEVFRHSYVSFGEGNVEKQIIDKARASLDKKLNAAPVPELEEEGWLHRTCFPVCMDGDKAFYTLKPDFEALNDPGTADIYKFIFQQTNDSELNLPLKPGYINTDPKLDNSYSSLLNVLACVEQDADPPNYEQAFRYYRQAAEEGNDASAQYNLGVFYFNGHGVKKDFLLSACRFKKASDRDFRDSNEHMMQATVQYITENIDRWSDEELFDAVIGYYRLLYGIENGVEEANTLLQTIADYYSRQGDLPHCLKCISAKDRAFKLRKS